MKLYNITFLEFIPDIINTIVLFLFFFFLSKKYKFKFFFIIITIGSLTLPFFFYWFLDWSYLPDQSKYAHIIYDFRNFNFYPIYTYGLINRVVFSSIVMSFFPIPFVSTIISVSLINKGFLLVCIFFFLKTRMVPNALILLLLLLPSYLVVSSVALRDLIVILAGIMFSYYFLKKRKFFKCFFFMIIFILAKPYLAALLVTILFVYYWFFHINTKLKIKFIVSLILIILLSYSFHTYNFFYELKLIRFGFIAENFNYRLSIYYDQQTTFFILLESFIKYLFFPIVTEPLNLITGVIFLENFLFWFILLIYLIEIYKNNKFKAIFWIIVLLFSSTLFGYLIANAGTLWRYKTVFQVVLLFSMYFSLNNKDKKIYLKE
jgi:hypothetical protein